MSNLFGRNYSDVGSTSSDLILKTRGLVKILFGSKFIDLIKDGKINADSKIIYESDKVGSKDGIYVVGDVATLVVSGKALPLTSEGVTYVSFLEEQTVTRDLQELALVNIGFIYKSLADVTEIKAGIVYVLDENKLYTVANGVASEFGATLPNPLTSQIVITKDDSDLGAIVINGTGANNGIIFNTMSIWSGYINFTDTLRILRNSANIILLEDTGITSNMPLVIDLISASDNSFYLKTENGTSVLKVDKITTSDSEDGGTITLVSPKLWYYGKNFIYEAAYSTSDGTEDTSSDESSEESASTIVAKLSYTSTLLAGDIVTIFIIENHELKEVLLPVLEASSDRITVASSDLITTANLTDSIIYLTGSTSREFIVPRIDSTGFHLVKQDGTVAVSVNSEGITTPTINGLDVSSITNMTASLAAKQDKLTAGTNITIKDNVISASFDVSGKLDKLTAGTGITISGSTISVTDYDKLLTWAKSMGYGYDTSEE